MELNKLTILRNKYKRLCSLFDEDPSDSLDDKIGQVKEEIINELDKNPIKLHWKRTLERDIIIDGTEEWDFIFDLLDSDQSIEEIVLDDMQNDLWPYEEGYEYVDVVTDESGKELLRW